MSTDAYIILNMYEIIFVTTKNCSLCDESYRKLEKFSFLFKILKKNVNNGYEEYIFRVPLIIYKGKILQEGQISLINLLKKLVFRQY